MVLEQLKHLSKNGGLGFTLISLMSVPPENSSQLDVFIFTSESVWFRFKNCLQISGNRSQGEAGGLEFSFPNIQPSRIAQGRVVLFCWWREV